MVGSVKMGGPTLQFQWDQGFYENVIGYMYSGIDNQHYDLGPKNVVSQKRT